MVGLDRAAAKAAFAQFTEGRVLSANQLEFINLIIEHLTAKGIVSVEALYGSPTRTSARAAQTGCSSHRTWTMGNCAA